MKINPVKSTKQSKEAIKYSGDANELSLSSKETTNTTTNIQPLTTSGSWCEFINNETLMLFPSKQDWRKRLIHTLLIWASKDDSLEITDFAIEMKMHRRTLYKWAEQYEDLRDALDLARLIIGSRRRKGTMQKKLDGAYAYRDMHMYDPEWHAVNKYHSDMKKEEEKQAHTFIISDAKPRIVTKEEMLEEVKE
jgi:hypothetical protein